MAFRFGSFEVQPHQRRLLVDGRAVAVGSRAFDVLVVLAERAGELVSKSELFDVVWPDTVVEENNLQVHVSALRRSWAPRPSLRFRGAATASRQR